MAERFLGAPSSVALVPWEEGRRPELSYQEVGRYAAVFNSGLRAIVYLATAGGESHSTQDIFKILSQKCGGMPGNFDRMNIDNHVAVLVRGNFLAVGTTPKTGRNAARYVRVAEEVYLAEAFIGEALSLSSRPDYPSLADIFGINQIEGRCSSSATRRVKILSKLPELELPTTTSIIAAKIGESRFPVGDHLKKLAKKGLVDYCPKVDEEKIEVRHLIGSQRLSKLVWRILEAGEPGPKTDIFSTDYITRRLIQEEEAYATVDGGDLKSDIESVLLHFDSQGILLELSEQKKANKGGNRPDITLSFDQSQILTALRSFIENFRTLHPQYLEEWAAAAQTIWYDGNLLNKVAGQAFRRTPKETWYGLISVILPDNLSTAVSTSVVLNELQKVGYGLNRNKLLAKLHQMEKAGALISEKRGRDVFWKKQLIKTLKSTAAVADGPV